MIEFNDAELRDLQSAAEREWLETNGLGGFASSTITGLNTRRYHGLLVAAARPPVGRVVLLSRLEETVIIGDKRFDLSVNQYPGVIHPQGHLFLKRFRLDPFPVFTYVAGGVELEKILFMKNGEDTTVVRYVLRNRNASEDISLEVRPLIAFRDYHGTTHRNKAINTGLSVAPGRISVTPYEGLGPLHFANDAFEVDPEGYWYNDFEYRVENERGLDSREDLFSPFSLSFNIGLKRQASIIASTEIRDVTLADEYQSDEIRRREEVIASSKREDELERALVAAADQYIVARGTSKTVIAGYHWFGDWGRDTMIALPGLTLATGRPDLAKSILVEFSRHISEGMLPNRFPDVGEIPEYNTVDATLWYFEAIRALCKYTGDFEFIRENLYPALVEIIDWHERGTRYGIRVDTDGLLMSGEPGVQLTWMDAKVGDYVVTPRTGKAVEIQALWYNALKVMEDLAHRFDDTVSAKRIGAMASRSKRSFAEKFWNKEAGCLYDYINGERRDASIRPNQILAVSLCHSMLSPNRSRSVVEVVERELLTPCGLRSLASTDSAYHPRYEGGVRERDTAYHQGTVWPWLMGPFITAYVRVNGGTKRARERARKMIAPLYAHLSEGGLGHISEILDGDMPHKPRGCIAQAWSVAEILRTSVEDINYTAPFVSQVRSANYARSAKSVGSAKSSTSVS